MATRKTGGHPLSERQRDRMPAERFAFPKERKEPLNDASHVRNAIARFNQVEGVTEEERKAALEQWLVEDRARRFDPGKRHRPV